MSIHELKLLDSQNDDEEVKILDSQNEEFRLWLPLINHYYQMQQLQYYEERRCAHCHLPLPPTQQTVNSGTVETATTTGDLWDRFRRTTKDPLPEVTPKNIRHDQTVVRPKTLQEDREAHWERERQERYLINSAKLDEAREELAEGWKELKEAWEEFNKEREEFNKERQQLTDLAAV